jgi:hypothetical protein
MVTAALKQGCPIMITKEAPDKYVETDIDSNF